MKKSKLLVLASLLMVSVTGCRTNSKNSQIDESVSPTDVISETQTDSDISIEESSQSSEIQESSSSNDEDEMAQYVKSVYMTGDTFKILNLTDTQLHDGDDFSIAKQIIDTLVERENPDMITLLGDIINDNTTYDVKTNARKTVELLDSYGIPWAPIFGNHDNLEYKESGSIKTGGVPYLISLFEKCDNCLYVTGPSGVQGKSNYMVNVLDEDNKLVESLVFLDSYTNGLQDTNVTFYEDCINYAKELNGGVMVPSVMFDHIPIPEYTNTFNAALNDECHNLIGNTGNDPLSAGTTNMFKKIKALGSTTSVICGHDHDSAFITNYQGINLVYAMKSSLGDNKEDFNYTHPEGGLVLEVGNGNDNLYYSRFEDITYELKAGKSLAFHPGVLPYWKFSGAKLVFDVEMPTTGHLKFNIQGSNFQRGSQTEKNRKGAWNRLTNNTDLGTDVAGLADFGTMTLIEGNKYRYEADLYNWTLNSGEDAYGDETARLIYIHSVTGGNFKITNIHWEYEEVNETNQLDLADATIASIPDVSFYDLPVKPRPEVKLNSTTLKEGADIIYTYSNNAATGTATLKVIPSGKGAHKYKGQITKTFKVVKGEKMRGEAFKVGVDYIKDISAVPLNHKLYLDIKFTSADSTHINVFLGDGWDHYFGYYSLNPSTVTGEYDGISVSTLEDNYIRYEFNMLALTKVNNTANGDKSNIKKINLVYIRGGDWSNASGYVDIIEETTPVDEHRGTLETGSSHFDLSCYPYTVSEGGTLTIDYVFANENAGLNDGISLYLGTDRQHCFGAIKIYKNRLETTYDGISFEKLEDGYNRLLINVDGLTNVHKNSDGAPTIISKVMFDYFEATDGAYFDININGNGKDVILKMTTDEFKVINFTDIHIQKLEDIAEGSDVRKTIEYAMSNSNPDAVVFSGDFIHATTNLSYVDAICDFMDTFEVPYFFVFGNHDREKAEAIEIAEHIWQSDYGYIDLGPKSLESSGNYVVKVENADGDLVHALIMLDSRNKNDNDESLIEYVSSTVNGVKYGSHNGRTTYCCEGWDGVRGPQIDWYKEQAAALGCDSTVIMHAGMVEYTKAYENYRKAILSGNQDAIDACAPVGNCTMGEYCCGPCANYGLFAAIKEVGSTKNVICGHDHVNDFSLMYEGVRLTYSLKTGDGAYGGAPTQSGYTLLTIDSEGATTINQIYYDYTK